MAEIQITIETLTIDHVTIGTAPPEGRLHWHIGPVVTKETSVPQEVTLTREQRCRFFVQPLTPGGDPATLDGPVQFSIDGLCTLEPIDATSTWVITPDDGVGDSVLTAQADADLGAGVVAIMDTATIHVTDPMAASLGLGADAPELKP